MRDAHTDRGPSHTPVGDEGGDPACWAHLFEDEEEQDDRADPDRSPEQRDPVVRTVGHGTISAERFRGLLGAAGVTMVVDVRRYPGSRRHPHFGGDAMATWLEDAGIGYRAIGALGGRRRAREGSPNTAWRNEQFAAYADHMVTGAFADGVSELLEVAQRRPTAIMCSESVWWRCHRRLVADHLVLVEGRDVHHLFHDGRSASHEPMGEACVVDRHVEYPAAQGELPGM